MENGGSRLVWTTRARETIHFADEEGVVSLLINAWGSEQKSVMPSPNSEKKIKTQKRFSRTQCRGRTWSALALLGAVMGVLASIFGFNRRLPCGEWGVGRPRHGAKDRGPFWDLHP